MRQETKRSFHFGVNYLIAPLPAFDVGRFLSLEQQLAQDSLVFDRRERAGNRLTLLRESTPLQVTVGQAGPPLAQLLIVAPNPNRLLRDFVDEAESVVQAYQDVWPGPVQIIRRDCTIRYLYAVEGQHAFQYLWERRLRQGGESLALLERGVLGGGMRFVMPAQQPDDATIEVRVEAFLQDSTQLFVETQFLWEQPRAPGVRPDPRGLLEEVNAFAEGPVVSFIEAV